MEDEHNPDVTDEYGDYWIDDNGELHRIDDWEEVNGTVIPLDHLEIEVSDDPQLPDIDVPLESSGTFDDEDEDFSEKIDTSRPY